MLVFSALGLLFSNLGHAAPRRLAVVNLATNGTAGAEAAAQVRAELDRQADFDPLPAGKLADALERPLPADSPERSKLASAQSLLRDAREAYATRGAHEEALDGLRAAQSKLASIPPEPEVRALLAEISIDIGVVALATQDRIGALESFRLARLLDPANQGLDPAAYDPEVVKVYAEAGVVRASTASLSIVTEYDDATIWIDGMVIAGRTAALPPGIHVVTATYPDHRPDGRRVNLVNSPQPTEVTLTLERLPVHERAEAMRRRLLGHLAAGGNYLEAAREIGALTSEDLVVLIRTDVGGRPEAMLWDRNRVRPGHWLPVGPNKIGDKTVARLLAPVLPRVPDNGNGGGIAFPPPPPPPKKWWERTDVRLGSAALLLGIGLTAIALSTESSPTLVDDGIPCFFDGC